MFCLTLLFGWLMVGSDASLPRIVIVHNVDYHCNSLLLGRTTEDTIHLPERIVGSHDYLFIANYCSGDQKTLVGEDVTVCDGVGAYPPSVSPVGRGFSPLRVACPAQNEPCSESIHVNITLYCEPAGTVNTL